MQRLDLFRVPPGFRGRGIVWCQVWWLVQKIFFSTSPQFMYGWRRFLLRVFGAKIGVGVVIRPSARVTYPWKLTIGDYSWVGDDVDLYTLGDLYIGNHSVISQRSYLCTGGHDSTSRDFSIYSQPIVIEDGVWLATDVFVAPGVTVGENSLIGARSSVFSDVKPNFVYWGTPAKPVRARKFTK